MRGISRALRGWKFDEKRHSVVHIRRTEGARVKVRPFESGGREGERVRVFSGGAFDRRARSAARVERDAFGGGDEDGWVDAVFARKREIECAEVPRVVGEPTCGRARGGESSRVYAKV